MGLRETTNYLGGCYGSPNAPHLTPLVDKMIGTAFPTVKFVAENMDAIRYVVDNMEAIVTLAKSQADKIAELQATVDVLSAMVIPKTPTIVAAPLSMALDRGDE